MSGPVLPEEQQDWSEVTIEELIEERDAFRDERDSARRVAGWLQLALVEVCADLYEVRAEREHARSLVVRLEQELAAAESRVVVRAGARS